MQPELVSLFIRVQNPVTPWLVLALCGAGWLALYLFTSRADRS